MHNKHRPIDPYNRATVYSNLADIKSRKGEYSEAKMLLDSSMYYSFLINNYEKKRDNLHFMYLHYVRKGQPDSALHFNEEYHYLKDSVFNEKKARIVNDIETAYRVQKKEKENAQLRAQTAEQDLIIAQNRNRIILVVAMALVVILVLLFSIRSVRLKQKAKLAEEKEKLKQENFKGMMLAEEQERVRIARELHDGLGQILSTAKLNVASLEGEQADPEDEKLVKNSMDLIDHSLKEVRAISHNLMPTALIEKGLVKALEEQAQKINESNKLKLVLEINGDYSKLEKSVEIAVYRIVQEVLSNMLRHSEADRIEMVLNEESGKLRLLIKDNGKGFDTSTISKSKGIGWKNIFSRVSMFDGLIDIKSAPGKGTDVKIELRG